MPGQELRVHEDHFQTGRMSRHSGCEADTRMYLVSKIGDARCNEKRRSGLGDCWLSVSEFHLMCQWQHDAKQMRRIMSCLLHAHVFVRE